MRTALYFKKGQVEEAVVRALEIPAHWSSSTLRTRLKRLLDTDRKLGADPSARDPVRAQYAFFSSKGEGSGSEVWFSGYEAFAVAMGLKLLRHGWPQRKVVRILRQARQTLALQHGYVLSHNPNEVLDPVAVYAQARESGTLWESIDPVFLVIVTRGEADRSDDVADEGAFAVTACRGVKELNAFVRQHAQVDMAASAIEIVAAAHRMAHHLSETVPKRRGRPSR